MSDTKDAVSEYRQQIALCVQSMAVARNDPVTQYIASNEPSERLEMFTDGNLDKRFMKLQDHFDEMADEFVEFAMLLERYIRCVPLAAYDSGSSDSQRFLDWLTATKPLTDRQKDHVACSRCRYAVEVAAESNRLAHLRFQELWGSRDTLITELEHNAQLWIHLNPIHVWSVFRTSALLDEDSEIPATILFYAVESDIRTAVLEQEAELLIRELEANGPSRLDDLVLAPIDSSRGELIEICHDLSMLGLVAFG